MCGHEPPTIHPESSKETKLMGCLKKIVKIRRVTKCRTIRCVEENMNDGVRASKNYMLDSTAIVLESTAVA